MGCAASTTHQVAPELHKEKSQGKKDHQRLSTTSKRESPVAVNQDVQETMVWQSNKVSLFGQVYKLHRSTGSLEHVGMEKQTLFVIQEDSSQGQEQVQETVQEGKPRDNVRILEEKAQVAVIPEKRTQPLMLALRSNSSDSVVVSEPHMAFDTALKLVGSPTKHDHTQPSIHQIVLECEHRQEIGFSPLVISAQCSFHRPSSTVSNGSDEKPRLRKAFTMVTGKRAVSDSPRIFNRTNSLMVNGGGYRAAHRELSFSDMHDDIIRPIQSQELEKSKELLPVIEHENSKENISNRGITGSINQESPRDVASNEAFVGTSINENRMSI